MTALHIAALLAPLPVTLPIALIDLRRQRIPDGLNLTLFGGGLGFVALRDEDAIGLALGLALIEALAAFAVLYGLRAAYARMRDRTGLGLGDVKFVTAAIPWIGLAGLPLMILIASTTALAVVAVLRLSGRDVRRDTRLPFGPFLALGLHAALILAETA